MVRRVSNYYRLKTNLPLIFRMKLSKDFSSLLHSAYETYNSSELRSDNTAWGYFTRQMFLLEDKDFDKALAILSQKEFNSQHDIESVISSKKSYGEKFGSGEGFDTRYFLMAHMLPDKIRSECTYHIPTNAFGKRSSRKVQLLREMLDEAWYSQSDYKLIRRTAEDVELLCRFWHDRTLISQQEEKMTELHSKLRSL